MAQAPTNARPNVNLVPSLCGTSELRSALHRQRNFWFLKR